MTSCLQRGPCRSGLSRCPRSLTSMSAWTSVPRSRRTPCRTHGSACRRILRWRLVHRSLPSHSISRVVAFRSSGPLDIAQDLGVAPHDHEVNDEGSDIGSQRCRGHGFLIPATSSSACPVCSGACSRPPPIIHPARQMRYRRALLITNCSPAHFARA